MIRKSNQKRRYEALGAFARALPDFQDANDAFDDAAAKVLGLNRTDMRALGAVVRRGPLAASAVAEAAKLSRSATTTALDRLEDAGYVQRVPDPDDRRSVTIHATPEANRICDQIWGPLAIEGAQNLERYSTEELEALARLLEEARELQLRHVDRVLELAKRKKKEKEP